MPFTSGTFALYTPGNPVVSGTTISSSWAINTMNDVATGLSTCVLKDGSQTITANLPMAGFRHTGVGNATTRAAATYASAADVQDGTLTGLTTVAGTNTITATAAISMTAITTNQRFTFFPANTNTGATTLNLNSIAAKNIFSNGAALTGGELQKNSAVSVVYDGTQFNIDNGNAALALNAQTGTTYVIVAADIGKRITFSNAGAIAATLPAPATVGKGWWCWLENVGATVVTVSQSGSETITGPGLAYAGATSFTLPYSGSTAGLYNVPSVGISTDGTNWMIFATGEAHGEALFSGSGSLVIPMGVSSVWVDGAAGGGGGGGAANAAATAGGGGGAGQSTVGQYFSVVPGSTATITIGAAGNGGAAGNNNGTAGSNTSVSGAFALTLVGGNQGSGAGAGGAGAGGTGGGANGGNGQAGLSTQALGGSGGGNQWAAVQMQTAGSSANGSAGNGYGGGGCGGSSGGGGAGGGGNGAAGFLRIRW